VKGLLDELEKLKYVEDRPGNAGKPGRHFVMDLRMGTPQELKSAARDFARKRVDFIVAIATTATRIAQEETKDNPIPILFPGISDPIGDGFVQSLARPGGVITGVSHQLVQGSGKRVELFKEMLPGLKRMVTLRRPGYGPAEKSMPQIHAVAGRLQIEVLDWTADTREDSLMISSMDLVIETSLAQGVPTFGLQDFMADWGAIGAYGPSAYQAGGRLAGYIDKISKGAKPGDLPVEPTDPIFVINLKAATCLGVPLPLTVLQQADRVIR
jgi:putative ABC transport system substrate-binding protein